MERIDGEKIIESLRVIKKICEDHEVCEKCPFEVQGICGVTDLEPQNWEISEYKKFQALE